MTDFQIGQRVIFTHPLSRRHTYNAQRNRSGRAWVPEPYDRDAATEQEGVIVGKRTLANGDAHFEEWVPVFTPTEHFQAYLIATDLHRKPVFVRVENVRRARLKWHMVHEETDSPMLLTPADIQRVQAAAWLQGAAAGASVDMGFIPSDALDRDLPDHLAGQFYALNPYTPREG